MGAGSERAPALQAGRVTRGRSRPAKDVRWGKAPTATAVVATSVVPTAVVPTAVDPAATWFGSATVVVPTATAAAVT